MRESKMLLFVLIKNSTLAIKWSSLQKARTSYSLFMGAVKTT